MLTSKTRRADTYAAVSEAHIHVKLIVPIRLYRLQHGSGELVEIKLLDEIDQDSYERAFNAYQRGDIRTLKTVVVEAVRRWVENRGGKLLDVYDINGELQLFIKST